MALIFWPGVKMRGEFPADEGERAERVERGVDCVDMVENELVGIM